MNTRARWVLPAGVKEFRPEQARHIEAMRRATLDVFERWGYELVIPPPIEFLDSLLIANDATLDLQTFKLTDQMSGRLMGVRADMTPQVARMDAHTLDDQRINRLCYVGTVLRARPDSVGGSRMQMQFGAEIYGSDALASDVEIVSLMLDALQNLGLNNLYLDLGHVGIATALIREAGLNEEQERVLRDLLQWRSKHEMEQAFDEWSAPAPLRNMLLQLVDLHGDCAEVVARARQCFEGAPGAARDALDELERLADLVARRSTATINCDLADPHGFHYQTGIVYAVYQSGLGRELARGGRCDDFGKVFGRARPSAGFSGDLLLLSEILDAPPSRAGIFAPLVGDAGGDTGDVASLWQAIGRLRAQGELVVEQLDESDTLGNSGCDRVLRLVNGEWQVCSAT